MLAEDAGCIAFAGVGYVIMAVRTFGFDRKEELPRSDHAASRSRTIQTPSRRLVRAPGRLSRRGDHRAGSYMAPQTCGGGVSQRSASATPPPCASAQALYRVTAYRTTASAAHSIVLPVDAQTSDRPSLHLQPMGLQQGRVAENLWRRPVCDNGAFVHDDCPGQELLHHAQVVRCDEHCLG